MASRLSHRFSRLSALLGLFSAVCIARVEAQALAGPPQQLTDTDLRALEIRYLDQVVVVAGDNVVTRNDILSRFREPRWRDRILELDALPPEQQGPAEQSLNLDATGEMVEFLLETQAGQDRGFDSKLVDALVERRFKEAMGENGGYRAFFKKLEQSGSSPEQFKDQVRRSLYRYAWRGAITGRQAGTTGRVELDRHVRPGRIVTTYQTYSTSPRAEERALVGIQEENFDLLELALGFKALGGREPALERARTLKGDIESGKVSVAELIDYWTQRDPQAREKAKFSVNKNQARQFSEKGFGSLAFYDFVTLAEPGDLSEPFESAGAAHLYQLVSRTGSQKRSSFQDWEVQEALRNHLEEKQMRSRLGRAHRTLIEESQLSNGDLEDHLLDPEWLFRVRD